MSYDGFDINILYRFYKTVCCLSYDVLKLMEVDVLCTVRCASRISRLMKDTCCSVMFLTVFEV